MLSIPLGPFRPSPGNLTGEKLKMKDVVIKPVYIFSGLGTDERVFKDIDLTGYSPVFVKWIAPYKDETIENYSRRLTTQITSDHPTLIGLSFGGMVAMEVCKHIEAEHLILIASAKTKNEIPFYFRMAGYLRLDRLVPTAWMKSPNFIDNWLFGLTGESDKRLLKEILEDTDPAFLRWAINQILHWKNNQTFSKVTHIHGRSDRILPYRFINADISIDQGGHFMTVNKSDELTRVIRDLL